MRKNKETEAQRGEVNFWDYIANKWQRQDSSQGIMYPEHLLFPKDDVTTHLSFPGMVFSKQTLALVLPKV